MPKAKKAETTVVAATKSSKLTAQVLDLTGKVTEEISLPEEIFGEKINKTLIAQAVRVRLANQRQGTASTKTRGEVEGSTRKIYRQKGTGRARHGSIRAPIFVHGGVVFGPKPRDYSLKLPQKMKRKALFSALSAKFNDGEIKILQGLEKLEPKTKKFAEVIKNLELEHKKKKILIITGIEAENLKRAAQNIEGVTITAAQRLNTYDILNHRQLIFMKESIEKLSQHFLKQEHKNKKEEK
jgi:large subunit ribosomal protein L4